MKASEFDDDRDAPRPTAYELVYRPLHRGPTFVFPCDEAGSVEMNDLTDQGRSNYLFVRALVGRDFQLPSIVRCAA